MKTLLFLSVLTFSSFSWSDSDKMVKAGLGENASQEYKDCLGEDKCPSQQCPNSCAMMNKDQSRGNIATGAKGASGTSKSTGAR